MRVKSIIMATSAAGALALSAGAASADPNGWYGAIDAGYNFWSDDVEARSLGAGPGLAIEVQDDWAAFARLGYRFTPNWRVELEGGYRAGDIESVNNRSTGAVLVCAPTPANPACEQPDGFVRSAALMLNVLYDFGDESWALRPFVGLGAGVNRVDIKMTGTRLAGGALPFQFEDDSSSDLAAQAIGGVAWALSDRANLDLTYRYIASNINFRTTGPSAAAPFGNYEGRYEGVHTVSLGLRYSFGDVAPPPPPPPVAPPPVVTAPPPPRPAPPPAPARPAAREFVVYFDWDRSDLTAEAQSVIGQAAQYARTGQPTRVLVVGHADTSGSAQYNIGLSNRRARTTADALVAQGVNGGVISLDGRGETELARPTADGVREPLNRRATININF